MSERKTVIEYEVGHAKPPREHMWRPGQSGNPGGRPRGSPKVSNGILRILKLGANEEFIPENKADQLALSLYDSAMKGDTWASKEILLRTEGAIKQSLEVTAAQLPTAEIAERLIEAFTQAGIDEARARQVLMLLDHNE